MSERKGEFVLYSEISYYQDKIEQLQAENKRLREAIGEAKHFIGVEGLTCAEYEKLHRRLDALLKEKQDE